MERIEVREADRVAVTVLVDNYIDIFLREDRGPMVRPPLPADWDRTLLAEHGFAAMVEIDAGNERRTLMLDAALTPTALLHNADVAGKDLGGVEAIVLSHGHVDHFGGLVGLLGETPRNCPIIAHPDAFRPRRFPGKDPRASFHLDPDEVRQAGADINASSAPCTCCGGTVGVTGEIERATPFETGFPGAEIQVKGNWQADPFRDDQAIVLNVKDKGLVVISGCAHAGIINSVRHAQRVTGIEKVHAVLGGFHLTGPAFEPRIPATIEAIRAINPDYIVPMHCTGWKAINQFAAAFADKFILNSVGTSYIFQ